jgi:hypothetical protein
VRESISPHSSPTFCVKKATGGWRIVHAFNKLNDVTIPAQTPIPRKDITLDSMAGSEVYSAIDLTDGFYQIIMRESDVPLTAVSTPSGMLWEWLVIPPGLKNAPVTFNRMVSQVLRSLRDFASSYFDDIFVHSKAEPGRSAVEVLTSFDACSRRCVQTSCTRICASVSSPHPRSRCSAATSARLASVLILRRSHRSALGQFPGTSRKSDSGSGLRTICTSTRRTSRR